jgi:site-specific DNA-cytosine methylase
MSFEDDFVFPESQSMTAVARQIGNAVPPLLAGRLAESIATQMVDVAAAPTLVAA